MYPMKKIILCLCLWQLGACQSKETVVVQDQKINLLKTEPYQPEKDDSPVLAQVGDVVITEKEFERRLNLLTPFTKARYQSPERKKEFLDSLIRFELLALESKNRNHHLHPDVQLNYKQALVKEFMKREIRNLVKISDITEAEVKEYYQTHLEDYQRSKQVRGAQILYKDQQKAEQALLKLLEIQKSQQHEVSAQQGEAPVKMIKDAMVLKKAFGDLALTESMDEESKGKRGDLQYLVKESKQPKGRLAQSVPPAQVINALFELKEVGEIYPSVVKSDLGFHLIQKTGDRPAFSRSLENVEQEIKNQILRLKKNQAMDQYLTQLKSQTKITIDEEALQKVKIDLYASPPPSTDLLMNADEYMDQENQESLENQLKNTLNLNPFLKPNAPHQGYEFHGHQPVNPSQSKDKP